MLVTTQFAIISAERPTACEHENNTATDELENDLKGCHLDSKRVLGYYGGKAERSFVVPLADLAIDSRKQVAQLITLARIYAQDCILYVDACSQAWLIGACDEPDKWTHIGKWQEVELPADGNVPAHWDAYTHDPAEDTYYVAQ